MSSAKKFDKSGWTKKKILKYLNKLSIQHQDTGITIELVRDPSLGYALIAREGQNLVEAFVIDTIYDLYKANYIMKRNHNVGDFLFAYPLMMGESEREAWKFVDLITDQIVYRE